MNRYEVEVISIGGDVRINLFNEAVRGLLQTHGLHLAYGVDLREGGACVKPDVTIFLGSAMAAADDTCNRHLSAAISNHRLVIPVHDLGTPFFDSVPAALCSHNAFTWNGEFGAYDLARVVVEELGIEDKQRKVFISYRRADALQMAEQLHDELTKRRFLPFVDRFAIEYGEEIQPRIADALEDFAFLLLIESPLAHESKWVFYEVDYAISHYMGVLIVRWPGGPTPIPGTPGLPRLDLCDEDLAIDHEYQALTDASLARVVAGIESAHAIGLVRRRKNLLENVQETALAAGFRVTAMPNWRLLVDTSSGERLLVGVTPRLPTPQDLHELDVASNAIDLLPNSVMVHAARALTPKRSELLEWCINDRDMTLIPSNSVGSQWR